MPDFSVLSFLDEAKHLAELSYAVFQCIPKTKIPFASTAPQGCNSATTDLNTIKKWWTQYPDCNIGIKCGNILVIDPDCKDGYDGAKDLANIVNTVGALPDSPLVRTGSGGWHLFFARPKVDIVGSNKIEWQGVKTGIDIQVGNQYVGSPPPFTRMETVINGKFRSVLFRNCQCCQANGLSKYYRNASNKLL